MKSNKISQMMARANVNNNPSQSITSASRAGIGAFPVTSPSLPPVFTFGAVSPIAPVATFPIRGFLAPNGLLQNACHFLTRVCESSTYDFYVLPLRICKVKCD